MKRGIVNRVRKHMKRGALPSSAPIGEEHPGTSMLEVKRLQERVNHLAVEVFHLTTELDKCATCSLHSLPRRQYRRASLARPRLRRFPSEGLRSYPLTSASNVFRRNVLCLSWRRSGMRL